MVFFMIFLEIKWPLRAVFWGLARVLPLRDHFLAAAACQRFGRVYNRLKLLYTNRISDSIEEQIYDELLRAKNIFVMIEYRIKDLVGSTFRFAQVGVQNKFFTTTSEGGDKDGW